MKTKRTDMDEFVALHKNQQDEIPTSLVDVRTNLGREHFGLTTSDVEVT